MPSTQFIATTAMIAAAALQGCSDSPDSPKNPDIPQSPPSPSPSPKTCSDRQNQKDCDAADACTWENGQCVDATTSDDQNFPNANVNITQVNLNVRFFIFYSAFTFSTFFKSQNEFKKHPCRFLSVRFMNFGF